MAYKLLDRFSAGLREGLAAHSSSVCLGLTEFSMVLQARRNKVPDKARLASSQGAPCAINT